VPGEIPASLKESDMGAKIAMVFMKDISYYNSTSDDENSAKSRKAAGAAYPRLRATDGVEKLNLFGRAKFFNALALNLNMGRRPT
jgi:hypothetical protein